MNKNLSICITVKNRSRVESENGTLLLFPNCIDSIVRSIPPDISTEIVITDWESDDWPIKKWITERVTDLPVHLITLEGKGFSRGKGLNIAADQAEGKVLFFMDADMIVSPDVIRAAYDNANNDQVYIPQCKYYINGGRDFTWDWGVGNMCMSSERFYKAGKWPEYSRWGFEDHDFLDKLKIDGKIIYKRDGEFVHQWHPQSEEWKNRYADKSAKAILEIDNRRVAHKKIVETEEELIIRSLGAYAKRNGQQQKPKNDRTGSGIPRIGEF